MWLTVTDRCQFLSFDKYTIVKWGFPGGSDVKASACNAGDPGSIPGLGRSPAEGNAIHSSTLAWKIPWMGEPDRLQSMGSQRVRHDWETSLSFCNSFWRRKWQPTPVFLPGESHGQRDLVGCGPWGCKESDTTEQLTHTHFAYIHAKYSLERWTDTHLIITITFMRYALLLLSLCL